MGGNLGFHLLRQKFDENVIRFWIAELACAINYLHRERVVHRDIKPDNILLDEEGHAHLSDFNIASHLPSNRPLTSQSGTALYMGKQTIVLKPNSLGHLIDDKFSIPVKKHQTCIEVVVIMKPLIGGG
jgi:serine/threonine protein kinase